MNEWIIILSLIVALAALATANLAYCRCRKMRREKDCNIVRILHEQDLLIKELEHIRIEKQTIERLLTAKLRGSDKTSAQKETT